ncbi:hypothetical protein, partial [Shewanella intestini]|uniref:hypothetical protein n=1 Tax=Shewanella sp. XMDDZSB0408 TaxID=2664453 RepID=UPI001E591D3F
VGVKCFFKLLFAVDLSAAISVLNQAGSVLASTSFTRCICCCAVSVDAHYREILELRKGFLLKKSLFFQ